MSVSIEHYRAFAATINELLSYKRTLVWLVKNSEISKYAMKYETNERAIGKSGFWCRGCYVLPFF